jgi:granule-bound starch synthase
MNWLQAGFKNADKCVTVSVNYAKELISGPSKGVELDKVLSAVGIEGIVNGMDPTEWNPAKDKFLDFPYEETTVIEGKACAKQALQAEVGLPIDPEAPLFGYIGRLEEQKGCDIMFEAIPKLIEQIPNAQVVVLGTGKKSMEKMLENLGETMPATNFAGVCKFSAPTAHFINAGADFLMVPSRFEPCGLIQLHAMSYGTVPIVATTGGLVDTVKEGITGYHMGAMDADNLVPEDVEAMVETCVSAAADFGTPAYEKMVKTCIKQDLTWKEPAKKWEALLEELAFGTEESAKKAEVIEPEKLASGIAATTA